MPRSGAFNVWDGDDYYTVLWSVVERRGAEWLEATIGRPQVGPQGTETDPLVDVVITKGRSEWSTVGAYDGSVPVLVEAIQKIHEVARRELEQPKKQRRPAARREVRYGPGYRPTDK